MAPTKDKKEKLTADEGADLILDYLKKQNRPYSAADISSNLLNRVSKSQRSKDSPPRLQLIKLAHTQKYLKELEERNRITSRAAGKQVVYHTIQSPSSTETSASKDVEKLDDRLRLLRTSIATLKNTEKSLKAEIASYATLRTFDEIQSTVEALKTQKEGLIERLVKLKSSATDIKPVSEVEKTRIEADLIKWKKQAKLRKNAVRDLWYMMKDTPKSDPSMKDADLWEFLGCEGSMPC